MAFNQSHPATIQCDLITSQNMAERLKLGLPHSELPSCGQLPEGGYYSAVTSDQSLYKVFPTKGDYISYFINHYFCLENTSKDPIMRPYLLKYRAVPVDILLEFPRLKAINTQADEVSDAVTSKLPELEQVEMKPQGFVIRRRDQYYDVVATAAELAALKMTPP